MKSPALLLFATGLLTLRCEAGRQWVAVVAPGLDEAIRPLADQRRAEGWQVTVIPAQPDTAPTMKQIAAIAAQAQPCCVVLAGDFSDKGVPAGKGTQLRMTGEPTDRPWTTCASPAAVEVGRLPARDAKEAGIMVQKILTWPRERRTAMAFPSAALLAGHHGAPQAFSGIADNLTGTLSRRLISRLPPAWQLNAAVHIDGSPWQVSGDELRTVAAGMMISDATLFAWMGHSFSGAAVSKNLTLLSGPEWQKLPAAGPRPGLFFTCGCFSCQVGPAESFGIAAMRAPGGPPAVIGSHGESWSAMGYLAMSGLTSALERNPQRAGEYWTVALQGLEKAEIDPAEFAMLDMADGTQGKVPLDRQRAEHMEMWMFLGDPAMTLTPPEPAIKLTAAESSGTLTVSGTLPDRAAGSTLRITIERPPSAVPDKLPEVPAAGADRLKAARDRRRAASTVSFASAESKVTGTGISVSIPIPAGAPPKPWTVRAVSIGPVIVSGIAAIPAP